MFRTLIPFKYTTPVGSFSLGEPVTVRPWLTLFPGGTALRMPPLLSPPLWFRFLFLSPARAALSPFWFPFLSPGTQRGGCLLRCRHPSGSCSSSNGVTSRASSLPFKFRFLSPNGKSGERVILPGPRLDPHQPPLFGLVGALLLPYL